MLPDEELPRGSGSTTHNISSSTISLGTIEICQIFENKVDLRMKLHVYAMKKKLSSK